MSWTRTRSMVAAAAGVLFAFTGCASSGGGGGTYRGVQLYEKGQNIYVCRQAHTASTRDALVERLESGQSPQGASTGQSVSIVTRESVRVGGENVSVARVEPDGGGSRYWIPYTALCSKSG